MCALPAHPELRQESRVSDSIASLDESSLLGPGEGSPAGELGAYDAPLIPTHDMSEGVPSDLKRFRAGEWEEPPKE